MTKNIIKKFIVSLIFVSLSMYILKYFNTYNFYSFIMGIICESIVYTIYLKIDEKDDHE